MTGPEIIPIPPLSSDAPGQPLPLAAAPGEKKKRIRRTKAELAAAAKKDAAPEGEQAADDKANEIKEATAALSVTFQAIGTILSAKRGPHWKLKTEECDALGGAWANVLAPYLSKYGKSVPLVGALVVTWSVAQPRILEDQERKETLRKLREGLDAPPASAPPLP
jgi:hypothetical protein